MKTLRKILIIGGSFAAAFIFSSELLEYQFYNILEHSRITELNSFIDHISVEKDRNVVRELLIAKETLDYFDQCAVSVVKVKSPGEYGKVRILLNAIRDKLNSKICDISDALLRAAIKELKAAKPVFATGRDNFFNLMESAQDTPQKILDKINRFPKMIPPPEPLQETAVLESTWKPKPAKKESGVWAMVGSWWARWRAKPISKIPAESTTENLLQLAHDSVEKAQNIQQARRKGKILEPDTFGQEIGVALTAADRAVGKAQIEMNNAFNADDLEMAKKATANALTALAYAVDGISMVKIDKTKEAKSLKLVESIRGRVDLIKKQMILLNDARRDAAYRVALEKVTVQYKKEMEKGIAYPTAQAWFDELNVKNAGNTRLKNMEQVEQSFWSMFAQLNNLKNIHFVNTTLRDSNGEIYYDMSAQGRIAKENKCKEKLEDLCEDSLRHLYNEFSNKLSIWKEKIEENIQISQVQRYVEYFCYLKTSTKLFLLDISHATKEMYVALNSMWRASETPVVNPFPQLFRVIWGNLEESDYANSTMKLKTAFVTKLNKNTPLKEPLIEMIHKSLERFMFLMDEKFNNLKGNDVTIDEALHYKKILQVFRIWQLEWYDVPAVMVTATETKIMNYIVKKLGQNFDDIEPMLQKVKLNRTLWKAAVLNKGDDYKLLIDGVPNTSFYVILNDLIGIQEQLDLCKLNILKANITDKDSIIVLKDWINHCGGVFNEVKKTMEATIASKREKDEDLKIEGSMVIKSILPYFEKLQKQLGDLQKLLAKGLEPQ
jgi:hypothetical protein